MAENEETTPATNEPAADQAAPKQPTASDPNPNAEKQGEVKIDKKAKADVLGGDNVDEVDADQKAQHDNLENAKQEGITNHQAEHANDTPEA